MDSQKLMLISLLVFLHLIFNKNGVLAEGCNLNVKRKESPLIFSKNNNEILYPEIRGNTITLPVRTTVLLMCGDGEVHADSALYPSFVDATCDSRSNLIVDGIPVNFNNVKCACDKDKFISALPGTCGTSPFIGVKLKIGLPYNGNQFLECFSVCFNKETQQSLYSEVTIHSSINERPTGIPGESFTSCKYFDIRSPTNYYKIDVQNKNINILLGWSRGLFEYVQNDGNHYLAKGHLTAKTDVFYAPQQELTFTYLNTAPFWQCINNGNWKTIEKDVKDYAVRSRVKLRQYTGVFGVATLPHFVTHQATKLYLYNENGRKALPVPALFWKVVYEPDVHQRGVVIIIINDPYYPEKHTLICKNIIDRLTWLNWEPHKKDQGYGYACEVDDFRKAVTFLPPFTVTGILN